jgi:tRNA nucleotidyltransferase (CCA-adding enzyme)
MRIEPELGVWVNMMQVNIEIPDEVLYIINSLESGGYEAYAVGGCVRDVLFGKTPSDWDICTSALPEQTKECFKNHHIIETGLRHGTVTLVQNRRPFEITTYRVDGKYTDNRRPDEVEFVGVLKMDLARRDFTINAMAYNPKAGLVDCYGGRRDLAERKIRCVGNPDDRFREDALRIMRALRFASAFGFSIDRDTAKAMQKNKKLLCNIAAERIAAELSKLLVGNGARDILSAHTDIIAEVIPEILHCHDGPAHTLASVEAAPKELVIRLAMLFHDISKPGAQESSDMAKKILSRLKYDGETIKTVTQLILYRDADIEAGGKHIKRWLNRIGEERLRQLLSVKRADIMAQPENCRQAKLGALDAVLASMDEIVARRQCFSRKGLAVSGRELIDAGVPEGSEVGAILDKLVDMVIDGEAENDKAVLLEIACRGRFP